MTMKNNYSIEERNRIVEEHLWCVKEVVKHNKKAIRKAGLDVEDMEQELGICLIRAAEKYDETYGDIRDYIFMELQNEATLCLTPERAYGITGLCGSLSADAVDSLERLQSVWLREDEKLAA